MMSGAKPAGPISQLAKAQDGCAHPSIITPLSDFSVSDQEMRPDA